GGHRVLLEKFGTGVRIVDRTGFYKDLAELSKRYAGALGGDTFVVYPSGGAVFIKQVTARLLNGVPTLMMYANAIVELSENLTVPELDMKFQTFKAQQAKTSPAAPGAQTITVARGDTLSGLAKTHYGAFEYWPLLWDANRSTIGANPNVLTSGMKLNVPPFNSFSPEQLADARRRHPTWKNF
ncbi:MAG: LysM peptidoglycan-binding domain-containing protein, partial [Planctomycetes bacterium]|nr:LysM peptidoglycan-binding domain-containing protein [Planctomycetota bacterium]